MLREGGAPAAGPDHRGAHAYVVQAMMRGVSINRAPELARRGAFFPLRAGAGYSRRMGILLSTSLALFANLALAQADPAADHYKAGVAHFHAGQFAEAIQEFRPPTPSAPAPC